MEEAGLLIKDREIYKPMKRKDNNLEQFEKALENGNYFSWDFSTKLYACQAYAQEITNLSLRSKLAPCATKVSFSISPNLNPPSFNRPSVGCLVSNWIGPRARE